MRTGKQHLFRLIVVAGAALAAAAPSAQAAGKSPDDRAVYRGSAAALAPKSLGADDRPSYRGSSATLVPKSPSPDDRAFARSTSGIEPRTIPAAVVARPAGFDWGDAFIGGTLGLAFAFGAGAVLMAVRHRRSVRTA